jgi:hypothetical protein
MSATIQSHLANTAIQSVDSSSLAVRQSVRTDLVRRSGYRDLNSGHAALSGFLLTGIVPPFVEKKLAGVLQVDQDFLDTVLIATARQRHDEARARILAREDAYRATFRPYLQVQTERRDPSPIFIAALLTTKRLRIVPLPDGFFR